MIYKIKKYISTYKLELICIVLVTIRNEFALTILNIRIYSMIKSGSKVLPKADDVNAEKTA